MISGLGLHSGAPCRVRLHVAEGGVRFRRGGREVAAKLEHVTDTQRCTTLSEGSARVALVEHLLAALHVRGWWQGLVIEASADELPILDGSAAPWLPLIDELGPPPPPPQGLRVEKPFSFSLGETRFTITPGPTSLSASIHFPHPAVGRQHWRGAPETYDTLLSARTFGFLSELEALRARGLATAAGLENAIVFGDEASLQPLRSPDEPVRHKALDWLGDSFLLGRPLLGALEVVRGSHGAHIAFLRALTRASQASSTPLTPEPTSASTSEPAPAQAPGESP